VIINIHDDDAEDSDGDSIYGDMSMDSVPLHVDLYHSSEHNKMITFL